MSMFWASLGADEEGSEDQGTRSSMAHVRGGTAYFVAFARIEIRCVTVLAHPEERAVSCWSVEEDWFSGEMGRSWAMRLLSSDCVAANPLYESRSARLFSFILSLRPNNWNVLIFKENLLSSIAQAS